MNAYVSLSKRLGGGSWETGGALSCIWFRVRVADSRVGVRGHLLVNVQI